MCTFPFVLGAGIGEWAARVPPHALPQRGALAEGGCRPAWDCGGLRSPEPADRRPACAGRQSIGDKLLSGFYKTTSLHVDPTGVLCTVCVSVVIGHNTSQSMGRDL